jgi:two-component system, chemotaxis family, chemotaxis protein CheY
MRILIVDDEFVSRTKLETLLGSYGTCDSVEHGRDALDKAIAAYENNSGYDLITIDISMPDMDGHEVVQELRLWEHEHEDITLGCEARVIMITSTKKPRDVMSSFSEGADAYLVKPVTPESIREAINEIDFKGQSSRNEAAGKPATSPAQPPAETSGESLLSRLGLEHPTTICIDSVETEFVDDYLDSTRVKLIELETAALDLEQAEQKQLLVDSIMRTLHSLKGEAGMIGLGDVQAVCHETETLVKDNPTHPECAQLVLTVKDWLDAMVEYVTDPTKADSIQFEVVASPRRESSPKAESAKGGPARLYLTPAGKLDLDSIKSDFWEDYSTSTVARLPEFRTAISAMEDGGDTPDLREAICVHLNCLKGEAAMIGMQSVRVIVEQAEEHCKTAPAEEVVRYGQEIADWFGDILGVVEQRRTVASGQKNG